mmetsp:Transcript_26415/g.67447  ORF Transcript_26415/g.67447 Transcript_26415/m.67447 type:complete len:144 (+) Transcript_26415:3545-3976(+)
MSLLLFLLTATLPPSLLFFLPFSSSFSSRDPVRTGLSVCFGKHRGEENKKRKNQRQRQYQHQEEGTERSYSFHLPVLALSPSQADGKEGNRACKSFLSPLDDRQGQRVRWTRMGGTACAQRSVCVNEVKENESFPLSLPARQV